VSIACFAATSKPFEDTTASPEDCGSCPLLAAQSGHGGGVEECPLSGVKRTSQFDGVMSAYDPKRTLATDYLNEFAWAPTVRVNTGRRRDYQVEFLDQRAAFFVINAFNPLGMIAEEYRLPSGIWMCAHDWM
jgi:hypothetical protein